MLQRQGQPGPGWLAILPICLLLFVVLAGAAWAAGGTALPGEMALLAVAAPAGVGLLPTVAAAISGPLPWGLLVLAVTLFLFLRGARQAAGALLLGAVVAEGAALLAKALVDRPRPEGAGLHDVLTASTTAFPSSHAARTVAVLGIVLVVAWPHLGRAGRLAAGLATTGFVVLVGLARLAAGEHWPADVLGGALLGLTAALGTARLVPRR